MDVIDHYLHNYAEEEAAKATLVVDKPYDAVLVVPIYRESTCFFKALSNKQYQGIQQLLLIVVSNHPNDLSSEEKHQALQCHTDWLKQLSSTLKWQRDNLSLYSRTGIDTLFIDRTGINALPRHQGVGLARKIGADVALKIWRNGHIHKPWVFCTDADVTLPPDYFSPTDNALMKTKEASGVSALIYPFEHTSDDPLLLQHVKIYEAKLTAYVEGLKLAGSPYAFHTVGSTLAIHLKKYAEVRGFPKRAAGEDFYLLNKLAKTGSIKSLTQPYISITARFSDRVPFGTGPALTKLENEINPRDTAIFYHPEIFKLLKEFLAAMHTNSAKSMAMNFSEELTGIVTQLGIEKFEGHVKKMQLTGAAYQAHFDIWFDGFRTLKFIHALRDTRYPSLSYQDWLKYNAEVN